MRRKKKHKVTDHMLEFASVVEWLEQLRPSGISHDIRICTSTRVVYLSNLTAFNAWLPGREFLIRVSAAKDNKIDHENVKKSFADVETLLYFGMDENGNAREVRRIINKYLADAMHEGKARATRMGMCAAIKSYFDTHDVMTYVRYDGRERKTEVSADSPELTLPEFYKMITVSKIDHLTRAVMLVKLQAGLDRSTLADRFNFYAYKQIAKFCGTINHREWSLDKCPIPIKLMRVKTDRTFTTFIDRDALEAIKNYLAWREETRGPHDPDGPMFFTSRNAPVSIAWTSNAFSKLAKYARTQKRLGLRTFKITSHMVRHLLKTTMLTCGCAPYAADHFLGHKPKDPYENHDLYPENLRKQYAKASHRLNVLSKAVSNIEDPEPADAAEKRLKAKEAEVKRLKKENNELAEANAKKDAVSAGVKAQLEGVVKAIIDTAGEPDGDFKKNLRDRLSGLV